MKIKNPIGTIRRGIIRKNHMISTEANKIEIIILINTTNIREKDLGNLEIHQKIGEDIKIRESLEENLLKRKI